VFLNGIFPPKQFKNVAHLGDIFAKFAKNARLFAKPGGADYLRA
jgi:hypothetical protein